MQVSGVAMTKVEPSPHSTTNCSFRYCYKIRNCALQSCNSAGEMMTYPKCRLQQFRGDILKPKDFYLSWTVPHTCIETLDVVLAYFLTQIVDAKPRASLTLGERFLVLLEVSYIAIVSNV